jgi:hypothetical protein
MRKKCQFLYIFFIKFYQKSIIGTLGQKQSYIEYFGDIVTFFFILVLVFRSQSSTSITEITS